MLPKVLKTIISNCSIQLIQPSDTNLIDHIRYNAKEDFFKLNYLVGDQKEIAAKEFKEFQKQN